MKATSLASNRSAPSYDLAPVVDALAAANADLLPRRQRLLKRHLLPSRDILKDIVTELRSALFPAHFGATDLSEGALRNYVGHRLDAALFKLREQVQHAFIFAALHADGDAAACEQRATEVTQEFALRLPSIRALLGSDARAAYEGDPAATSPDEAVFCYPGITAIIHHRIARELHELGVPLIPRIISEIAHEATGIDIHPGARIDGSFFIDHGTGVVIGETAIIGKRVRLYQGVTLGAKSFPTDRQGRAIKGRPRHPIVEDDVTIYAGATILGRITIGRGSSIGGNVWLTRAVPPGSFISQAHARDDLFEGGAGI